MAFMSSKAEPAYLAVVLRLQQLGLMVRNLVTDFELGLMNAFRRVYGGARDFRLSGCLRHHVVAVHKMVGTLGLVDVMLNSELARRTLRRLVSLPRLPDRDIAAGFRAVYEEVRRRDPQLYALLYQLLLYYHREWLLIVGATRLSVWKIYNSTNNTSEVSHTDFNREITVPVPNTWDVVGTFLKLKM